MSDERDDSPDWGGTGVVLVASLFVALLEAIAEEESRRLTVAMDVALERLDDVMRPVSPLRAGLANARSWWAGVAPLLLRLRD